MGRKTYDVGLKLGVTNPYPSLKQYVVSHSMKSSSGRTRELVSDDVISFVQELKKKSGRDIWLCGGAELAATLFPEIDVIILKSNPFLLGSGNPALFLTRRSDRPRAEG